MITSMALPRRLKARTAGLDLIWTLAELAREALDEWLVRHWSELTGGRGGRR